MMAGEVAVRTGLPVDDFRVRVGVGAFMGALMAAVLPALEDPSADFVSLFDRAFEFVDAGFPMDTRSGR
jgi:hypothetical protein